MAKRVGQSLGATLSVDTGEGRLPFSEQETIAENLVLMHDLDVCHLLDRRADRYDIVVLRGALVFDLKVDHDQEVTGIFHLAISEPARAE